MPNSRIYERSLLPTGGVTRAFVVGVGDYPQLPPGVGSRDLSTAAASAVAFSEWLIKEYQNFEAPLASVDLVLTPGTFKGAWCDGTVDRATHPNVQSAFTRWVADAHSSTANVAIFYFAGHGVWYDKPHLLTEDFDPSSLTNPWAGSFSMEGTHNGMARCKAAYQVFFIEACQTVPPDLYDAPGIGSPGLLARNVRSVSREAPIVYASKPHEPAYGSPGEVANFTSALLEFLRGAGADENGDGLWEIATSDLVNVREIMSYRAKMGEVPEQEPHCEVSGGRSFTTFAQPPQVRAHITAEPKQIIAQHPLSASSADLTFSQQFDPRKDTSPWCISLPKGVYRFAAGPVPAKPRFVPILSPRPIVVLS